MKRLAGPWCRTLVGRERGTVTRYDRAGKMVASLAAGGAIDKATVDELLRCQGFLIVDLPGGCAIEKEPDGPAKASAPRPS